MALRQTTGFVESLLRLIDLDWAVPNFSTLSRRQKTLKVNIPFRGTAGLKGDGPPILWVQLANAAGNHNGLVNALTGRLAETAGLQRATLTRMPNLADLLEAKSRLSRKQQETPLQSVRED